MTDFVEINLEAKASENLAKQVREEIARAGDDELTDEQRAAIIARNTK